MGRKALFDKLKRRTPLYSDLDIEYQQAYSGPYKPLGLDGVIAAEQNGRITGYGRPVVGDLSNKDAEKLWELSHDIWYMDYLFDGKLSNLSKFLLKKGLEPKPYYTQIIDLTQTEEELHQGLRKSYANLVNKDKDIYFGYIEWLRRLHRTVSGRETRSAATWEKQEEMIDAGQAFCLVKGSGCPPKVGGLFLHNNYACYYGVGCSMEGVSTHALIWKAILHAKSLGCQTFEMGEQSFCAGIKWEIGKSSSEPYPARETTEKEVNISNFKRGFGGFCEVRLEFGR